MMNKVSCRRIQVIKKDADYVDIDTSKWNTKSVCALLLQCYPSKVNFKQLHNPGMTTSVAMSATGYGILVTLVPSWHPNANKDSKVPFESSKTGMAYVSAHTKHFKYLDSNDTDGNPLKNVPPGFQTAGCPQIETFT
jgi:hypothetical protein